MAMIDALHGAEVRSAWSTPVQARAAKASAQARSVVYEDVHPGVYVAFVSCWASLLTVFAATFVESPATLFMIAICVAYAIMFFGVPYVLSRVGAGSRPVANASFLDFLRGEVDTLYGRVSGMEALTQVIMVPLALTLGGIAISLIVHFEATEIYMLYAF